jgi:hypothetical protein
MLDQAIHAAQLNAMKATRMASELAATVRKNPTIEGMLATIKSFQMAAEANATVALVIARVMSDLDSEPEQDPEPDHDCENCTDMDCPSNKSKVN